MALGRRLDDATTGVFVVGEEESVKPTVLLPLVVASKVTVLLYPVEIVASAAVCIVVPAATEADVEAGAVVGVAVGVDGDGEDPPPPPPHAARTEMMPMSAAVFRIIAIPAR